LLTFVLSTLFADVAMNAEDADVIQVGAETPNPALVTMDGESTPLEDLRNGTPTVIAFYRGGWCPYCNRQLSALQEIMPELKEKGWQLIALSPDKPEELKKTIAGENLEYTLVSDSKMEAAKAFGIAFQVDQPTIELYKTYKIDLVAASGEEHQQLPVPSVFLIDADGKITYAYSNPDYKVRLSSEELLKAIE
jgi:peroxiredoxin